MQNGASKGKNLFLNISFDFAGCCLFSAGIQCFNAPNNIAPGGVSGISVLINYLFGLPVSALSFLLNIPLLLFAWKYLGNQFTLRTLGTVGIMTVTLWAFESFIPAYAGETVLASLFGGVLEGAGLGLVFMRGSTTGGSDIASRLIQLKFPYISVGRIMLIVDGCVLLASAIIYGHLENALYGLITIFTSTRIVDGMLYGLDTGKVMMIVSSRPAEIARIINVEIQRGCTILQAKGSYTGEDRQVLLCAVRKTQFHSVKQLVYQIDINAFVVALEANEVIGEGFKAPV